jgi:poly(A) polymerase
MEKIAAVAEKEVERLFRDWLPNTPWKGKAYAVGGFVRDQYLREIKKDPSIQAKDLDVMVDSPKGGGAEQITKFINNTLNEKNPGAISTPHQMGESYPIWQITFKDNITYNGREYETKGAVIEFADSQKESFPDPKSRQRVTEPGTVEEDVMRRDFTVNMLLKDLSTGEIKDLTGRSKRDIEEGILTGHPKVNLDEMFISDPLRMLRLIRFRAKYNWKIPQYMIDAVKRNADRINIISKERIQEEMEKIAKFGKLSSMIRFMRDTDLLEHIMPEVKALQEETQSPKHHQEGDVLTHTLMVLDNAKPGLRNQMAALLHDIGKPSTRSIYEGEIKHHGHEAAAEEIAEAIMRRLKFKTKDIDAVKKMVKYHMRPHALSKELEKEKLTEKAIRKFIREIGDELVDSILDLAEADQLGKMPPSNTIPMLRERIEKARKIPISKKPILNGNKIKELLNLKVGPDVGVAIGIVNDIEDEYIQDNGKKPSKEYMEEELMRRWKKRRF